jgi:small subunit ribosomal protein S17
MPKRILQGVAVKDARDKTVIIRVERRVMHPVYKKFVMRSKKYAAHDENNVFKAGDVVRIEESRPISKRKRWIVLISAMAGAGEGETGAAPAAKKPAARRTAKPRSTRTKTKKAAVAAAAGG